MKILVTGANGQLGQEFANVILESGEQMMLWGKKEADICDTNVEAYIRRAEPTHLINCAAYTPVDLAETNHDLAYQVNAKGVANLADICEKLEIPIIHFSSDYVYHNRLRRPLLETDPTNPKGIYAKSKLKGEKLLQAKHSFPLILRVSWLYSVFGNNFPKTIIRLASQRKELNVVKDQIGTPTNARDLAEAVISIIRNQNASGDWRKISGVYNYSNEGTTNWFEIADHIVRFSHLNCQINPIPSKEFPTAAPRPRYSKLNLSKFKVTFGQEIRPWRVALEECLINLQTKDQ